MELVQEKRSGGQRWTAQRLTLMGLFTAVLCVSSYIVIPLPFTAVSITAQTMVVNLIGMILAPADTAIVFLVWICLGLAGAPVFSGGGGGAAKLFGPTGGYIIGFLFLALIGGFFVDRFRGSYFWTIVGLVLGMAVTYAFGTAWFVLQMKCTLWYALTVCVLPFAVVDVIKIVLATFVGATIRRQLVKAHLIGAYAAET